MLGIRRFEDNSNGLVILIVVSTSKNAVSSKSIGLESTAQDCFLYTVNNEVVSIVKDTYLLPLSFLYDVCVQCKYVNRSP